MMLPDATIKEEGAPAAERGQREREVRAGRMVRPDSSRTRGEIRNLALEPADEPFEALGGHDRIVLRAP